MATVHECDICGKRVNGRSLLWEVALRRCERPEFGEWREERFELCDRCKKRVYVAIHEGGGAS